jgi:hypothetical protein
MLAGVDDDRDHHRYGHEHNLVRANGIKDWRKNLRAIFTLFAAGLPQACDKVYRRVRLNYTRAVSILGKVP